jgi:8-oxo-dGTP pyrophosphatase MutT (NUDIX family)
MKNKWAGISGFIENEDPLSCAYREIFEETGIEKKFLPLQQEALSLFYLIIR